MEPPSLIEAIEMLTQGRGLAFQLRDLFQLDDQTDDRLVLAEDLLEKIHGSFTDSISALDLACESAEMKSEESGRESSKATTFANTRKAASNSKRSKMSQGETWTEVASTLIHDGHAWRKYGQKPILNAKHPRSYYKCTHKDDSGCPAKKHVQQTGDDPCSYRTVYSFRHTCTVTTNNPLAEAGQMILESAKSDMNPSSSIILNFQSNQHHSDHNNNDFLSSELNQEQMTSPQTANHCSIEYSPYISYSQDTEDPWFS